jgi:hypothetical protein
MRHEADHDPLLDYPRCWTCNTALSSAFNRLADLDLGPNDAAELIRRLRELALDDTHIRVMVGPYDHERRGDFDG